MKIKKNTLDWLTTAVGSSTVIVAGITQFWEELQPMVAQIADNPLPYALAFGYWVISYVTGKDE